MSKQDRPQIIKLEKPLHFGDWHDKPVRWNVFWHGKNQYFSTKKDAQSYARYWFKVKDEIKAVTTWTDHIGITVPIKR